MRLMRESFCILNRALDSMDYNISSDIRFHGFESDQSEQSIGIPVCPLAAFLGMEAVFFSSLFSYLESF